MSSNNRKRNYLEIKSLKFLN